MERNGNYCLGLGFTGSQQFGGYQVLESLGHPLLRHFIRFIAAQPTSMILILRLYDPVHFFACRAT